MIEVLVRDVIASASNLHVLTEGMVNGRQVKFAFTPEWSGLLKTAIFTNGIETKRVPEYKWEDNVVFIPPEVLSAPNCIVKCGVYGTDSANNQVIPTVWVELGRVFPAASPSHLAEDSVPPTPDVWDDLQSQIGNLKNLSTEVKINLVNAINEVLNIVKTSVTFTWHNSPTDEQVSEWVEIFRSVVGSHNTHQIYLDVGMEVLSCQSYFEATVAGNKFITLVFMDGSPVIGMTMYQLFYDFSRGTVTHTKTPLLANTFDSHSRQGATMEATAVYVQTEIEKHLTIDSEVLI